MWYVCVYGVCVWYVSVCYVCVYGVCVCVCYVCVYGVCVFPLSAVKIRSGKQGSGQLIISFHNSDELDGILQHLSP